MSTQYMLIRTAGQTDDGRGVIRIAHPEPSAQASYEGSSISS